MTVLSGTAKGFGSLAAYRIGVGIGESSASPAAFSMLGDYFPPRLRATAVAIYSSGVYMGAGVGMLIGGQVVERWNCAFPVAAEAPFGLVGWQAAFFAVGLLGITLGGICSDWLKVRTPRARLYCGLVTSIGSVPFALVLFTSAHVNVAYVCNFFFTMFSSFWIASAIAHNNELVIPRMRGIASANFLLMGTFIGLALGPFTIGRISTSLEAGGMVAGEALRAGILCGLGAYVLATLFLLIAMRTVAEDEGNRLERARPR